MSRLIIDCCSYLHTGVGFGQTPVRPSLIIEEKHRKILRNKITLTIPLSHKKLIRKNPSTASGAIIIAYSNNTVFPQLTFAASRTFFPFLPVKSSPKSSLACSTYSMICFTISGYCFCTSYTVPGS